MFLVIAPDIFIELQAWVPEENYDVIVIDWPDTLNANWHSRKQREYLV